MPELKQGGGLIIMGIPGPEIDAATRAAIQEIGPAGFILFGRNIKTPPQVRELTDSLRALAGRNAIITIDQEGGRVSRLREMTTGEGKAAEPPSATQLAEKGDRKLIARHGQLTGKLLRLFGFNLNLCPVLDISCNGDANNSLRGRTYGKSPDEVIGNARAFNDALRAEGILSCGKHFPGYSRVAQDPHNHLPTVERTRAELESEEWLPFSALRGEVDCLMSGHVVYPGLDPEAPGSLSANVIGRILRHDLKFNGVVISDDLDMDAVTTFCRGDFQDSARRAVTAGNDLVLICHRVARVREAAGAIAELTSAVLDPARERVEKLRARMAAPDAFSMDRWHEINEQIRQLRRDTVGDDASETPVDAGKRSAVEQVGLEQGYLGR
jgi:beta-N-acetylhexosaminidase